MRVRQSRKIDLFTNTTNLQKLICSGFWVQGAVLLILRVEKVEKKANIAPMSNRKDEGLDQPEGHILLEERPKTKRPQLYKVIMLNDDYTPMEFVVYALERFFGKDAAAATQIMLQIHQTGRGICGVYTLEIAETKLTQTINLAKKHDHPLQLRLERE